MIRNVLWKLREDGSKPWAIVEDTPVGHIVITLGAPSPEVCLMGYVLVAEHNQKVQALARERQLIANAEAVSGWRRKWGGR